ncbi:MAG: indoleamine 2,3-dioxygenase [Parcubacteria group bacterium Gr01-1014_70]|nr:MAG: indoleamine 2,3-dioxygenase [Parcubacteria group bacterium Gr01-1014_70]
MSKNILFFENPVTPDFFGCFEERGFLPPQDPLFWLLKEKKDYSDEAFEWEAVCSAIPHLLVDGNLREELEKLPPFPIDDFIQGERELEWAMRTLSFAGHAYVWGEKEPCTVIPANIAVPWVEVARRLVCPPVLSYASYALTNWYRNNPEKLVQLGNIGVAQEFLGGMDEMWFVLIHVAIEAAAGKVIHALWRAQIAAYQENKEEVADELHKAGLGLEEMCHILGRMPEKCDPYIYYHRVRPYLFGWKDNPLLSDGIVYEGCFGNQPQKFRGETGAQSSILPALDAFLGVRHQENELSYYLSEMLEYMPHIHREFVYFLQLGDPSEEPILRKYARKNEQVQFEYDHCITFVASFRGLHYGFARDYIANQAAKAVITNPTHVGTGGTPFLEYLHQHYKETVASALDDRHLTLFAGGVS